MQVVLLAAGMGLRLGPLTRTTPKAMVPLKDALLIDHTLRHLLASKHVSEVLVVGGFEYPSLEKHIESHYAPFGDRLRKVYNSQFTQGNLMSLRSALPHVEESFLLCNVDHLYSQATWRFILQDRSKLSIFCDFFRDFAPDEMKVSLDGKKRILAMAKDLRDYDCAYVGLTYVPQTALAAYKAEAERIFHQQGAGASVEALLPPLSREGQPVQVIPFDKHEWYEVDTREDLNKAEAALGGASATFRRTQAD